MKKIVGWLAISFVITTSFSGCATLKELGLIPSQFEMVAGLKDALSQGMFASFSAFANPQANPVLQFAFPGDAAKIEKTLRDLGLGPLVDKTTGKLTKAMGDAVVAAKPIFLNSIKQMSIGDAIGILVTDNPHAATDYFKRVNTPLLMAAFRPIVDSTVKTDNIDKDWMKITTVYNAIPFSNQKLETNLADFLAARAIDGMCLVIEKEEEKIRSQYAFRKTDMMKKAFGYAEQELRRRAIMGK
jgi:hypothetical protein